MTFIVLLSIILFIYFDLSVSKKQNCLLFYKIFSDTSSAACLWIIALLCLLSTGFMAFGVTKVSEPWHDYLATFFMITIFPLYLVKRYRFKKLFGQLPHLRDENLTLASDAFGVVLLWFLGMTVGVFSLKGFIAAFPYFKSRLGEIIFVAGFSFFLMVTLIYRMMHKHLTVSFLEVIGLKRNNRSWGKLVLLPGIIGLILAYISSVIIFSRPYQPSTPLSQIIESTTSSLVFLAFIVMAVLLAPFFEEIIFRGFFYYVISRFRGRVFTVCFIAVLFGVMHFEQYWGDWAAIIMVMLLGFVLTFLRAWTGSSIPSIMTHYVYNGAMTIIPVIMILLSNPVYFEYQMRYTQLDSKTKEELLLKSIHDYPLHADSYNDLAWVYVEEERDLQEAFDLIEKALALSPGQYAYLDTKAEILYKVGRIGEAISIAEDLVEQYPSDPYVRAQLEKFKKVRKPDFF